MKKKLQWFSLLALLSFFGAVYASAQAADPVPVTTTSAPVTTTSAPVQEISIPDLAELAGVSPEELSDAIQDMEDARTIVNDFDGTLLFPREWASAEAMYIKVQDQMSDPSTIEDIEQSKALFISALDAYEALAEKTIRINAEYLEDEVLAARDMAIREGAEYLAPEYLLGTDNVVFEVIDLYDAKDYHAAWDTGMLMRDAYNVMTVALEAYKIRMEIEDLDLYYTDSVNLDVADDMAFSALDDFVARDIAAASDKANDVIARYRQSFAYVIEIYATDTGILSFEERVRALEVKANVAARQEFEAADRVFIEGTYNYLKKEYDLAARSYAQSLTMFYYATEITLEKRREAERAIRAAELKIAESDETAYFAELLIGGEIE